MPAIPAVFIVLIVPAIPVPKAEPKKKGRKKRKYKSEPTPLTGMYNPQSGMYEKAISIREVYQGKIISPMDLFAWSPHANAEAKRFLGRAGRKKRKSDKKLAAELGA